MRMRKHIFLTLAFLWAAFIFVESTTPMPLFLGEPIVNHMDKVLHFGAFGVLAGLLFLSSALREKPAVATSTIYGIFIEFVQIFVGRVADVLDVLADFSGATVAVLLLVRTGQYFSSLKFMQEGKGQA